MNNSRPKHEPSPEEIRAACEEIQATWTDAVRRSRAAWVHQDEQVTYEPIKLDAKTRNFLDDMERLKGQGHQSGQIDQEWS
jgi:hypothetical protein